MSTWQEEVKWIAYLEEIQGVSRKELVTMLNVNKNYIWQALYLFANFGICKNCRTKISAMRLVQNTLETVKVEFQQSHFGGPGRTEFIHPNAVLCDTTIRKYYAVAHIESPTWGTSESFSILATLSPFLPGTDLLACTVALSNELPTIDFFKRYLPEFRHIPKNILFKASGQKLLFFRKVCSRVFYIPEIILQGPFCEELRKIFRKLCEENFDAGGFLDVFPKQPTLAIAACEAGRNPITVITSDKKIEAYYKLHFLQRKQNV